MKSAIASFVVYLFPLVLPHTVTVYGVSLAAGLGRRAPAWLAADIAGALGFQLVAFFAFQFLLFRPPFARRIAGLAVLAAIVVAVHAVHLVALPLAFLIDRDTAEESGYWPEVCAVPGASLLSMNHRMAADPLWALAPGGTRAALVDAERCGLIELEAVSSLRLQPVAVAGRGGALLQGSVVAAPEVTWWYVPSASNREPQQLVRPPGVTLSDGRPSISPDGAWVGWMRRRQTAGDVVQEIVRQPVQDGSLMITPLARLERGGFELLALDTTRDRAVVLVDLARIASVGLDGEVHRVTTVPGGIRPHPGTVHWTDEGWVAWDAYREDEPYTLAWQLDTGTGVHRALRGRVLTSVALNQDRTLIAVSTTTTVSIGRTADSIYVLRAADGTEVFRRYLPMYARSVVAFLGNSEFAYADSGGIHLLRITGE